MKIVRAWAVGFALCLLAPPAWGTVWTVDTGPAGDFPSVQACINAAAPETCAA